MIRRILIWAMTLTLLFSLIPAALAAEGTVTYNGTANQFIFEPGSTSSPTDLFPNLKNVMPGDTITQSIAVKNKISNGIKIRLYLRALGAHPDSEAFLSQLNLTVQNKTGTIMFDAPADQTTGLTNWVYLGTLYSGGSTELSVTLTVPKEMGNQFQDAVGALDWQFMVEELPIESTDPKTGDIILPYIIALAASGTGLILLWVIYRKKKKAEKQQR